MLNVKAWLVAILKADASLVASLGTADKIIFEYPNIGETVPVLTYLELNQPDTLFEDDVPMAVTSTIQFDVWTDNGASTSIIAGHVSRIMTSLFFACEYSADLPDPDAKLRHRVMRFSRSLTASDLT